MGDSDTDFEQTLRFLASSTRAHAHRPYSGLAVGAAIEVELADGTRAVFGGCNVENASYGLTMCAERVAIGAAVAAGARRVTKLVVSTAGAHPITPCGACRQVLAEFAEPDAVVICVADDGTERRFQMSELLPASMGPSDLPERDRPSAPATEEG